MDRHNTPPAGLCAVIFDCDGTLVDSEPIGMAALLEEAAAHGLAVHASEALALLKGVSMSAYVEFVESRLHKRMPDDFVPKVRRRMARFFRERLRPIPGALPVVSGLALPCCVASNGPREKIELALGLCGLLPLFEGAIFSAYEVGHWKPAPGLFLHAASAMGVDPARCAVVEDSTPGIEAGLAAGMTVFALYPAGTAPPPHLAARVERIESLYELPQRLARISNSRHRIPQAGRS